MARVRNGVAPGRVRAPRRGREFIDARCAVPGVRRALPATGYATLRPLPATCNASATVVPFVVSLWKKSGYLSKPAGEEMWIFKYLPPKMRSEMLLGKSAAPPEEAEA